MSDPVEAPSYVHSVQHRIHVIARRRQGQKKSDLLRHHFFSTLHRFDPLLDTSSFNSKNYATTRFKKTDTMSYTISKYSFENSSILHSRMQEGVKGTTQFLVVQESRCVCVFPSKPIYSFSPGPEGNTKSFWYWNTRTRNCANWREGNEGRLRKMAASLHARIMWVSMYEQVLKNEMIF